MGALEIIYSQDEIASQITRSFSNYKKSKARITKSYVETRLELLESNFKIFKGNHFDILKLATADEKKNLNYFKEDCYYTCEDTYLEFKTIMKEQFDELYSHASNSSQQDTSNARPTKALKTKLPAIEIPAFSGSYHEWTGFYDLFKSLIHENAELSNIQKYHYLKSNLKGEAEILLRQFPLTEANYEKALEVLKARYDNKRLIVHAHITRLLNQKKLSMESSKGLRTLLDTTCESMNALNNVGVSTTNWDPLITHIIVAKFDLESQRLWEQKLGGSTEVPTTKQLLEFMEMRFRSLEALTVTQQSQVREAVQRQHPIKTFKTNIQVVCSLCNKDHYIYNCKEFVALSLKERRDAVKEKQLCFNCLVPGHSVLFCKQTTSCKICKRRHHSLLHLPSYDTKQAHATQINEDAKEDKEDNDTSQLAVYKADITDTHVLLATALVRVLGKDGKTLTLRALIDQGSQASFITTSAAQRLGLRKEHHFSKVTGIDPKLSTVSKELVGFNIFSLNNDTPIVHVKAHVLKSLASILPRQNLSLKLPSEIRTLPLADPTFSKPGGIDLLLGADIHAQIMIEGLKKYDLLIAQNTHLGWLISGKVDGKHTEIKEVLLLHSQLEIDEMLQRFWESEELNNTKKRILTASETECEKIFEETHSRTDSGRYVVALPFSKYNGTPLGETRSLAVKRLLQMERRFSKNKLFQERYQSFMIEYEELHHMEKVPVIDLKKPDVCYLPHHGVIREESTTTKLRVVFDGSAESSTGASLNKKLLIGPALQSDIRDVFLRWRTHRIGFVADIQRMYRQILVRKEDQDYQRILWRSSPADSITEYRLRTVTYGTSCAPYLAIKVLKQLANDERGMYPNAARVLESSCYVDDVLSGCDTELAAIALCNDLTVLLQRGGMVLHKWGSNSENVLKCVNGDDNQPQESYDIVMDKSIKTSGVPRV